MNSRLPSNLEAYLDFLLTLKTVASSNGRSQVAWVRKDEIANQRLQAAHCVYFACHGVFDLASPLRSALVLAGVELDNLNLERCLTLEEIIGLNLSHCRRVTLSACETGLIDSSSLMDEYVGLASGFLYAGSLSAVSCF